MTFRARLTLWYITVLTLLLALMAVGLLYALGRIAEKKFDAALWMIGATEAENAAASVHDRGLERPDDQTVSNTRYRETLGYEQGPLEKYVTIVDDAGRVADQTNNLAAPLPTDQRLLARSFAGEIVYQTVNVDGVGHVRVVYMPVRGATVARPFVVMTGLPESFVTGELSSFRLLIVMSVVTLLLLTSASAMMLAERAIKPLEKVASAAERITAFNLQERLPESDERDQIGRLVRVFNQMLARLGAAFEAQQRFTARAAHELRTPLTILKGEAQVALRHERSVAEYENLLRSNLEEVEKLCKLIDGLLLTARYEGGETSVLREHVRLDEIISHVADDLRPVAAHNGVELRVETKEQLLANGDRVALERLVCNLLENALSYTPRGGRVTARAVRAKQRVNLVVEDTGIGISSEDIPHLFERFHRSQAAREMRPEGVGIGLSLAAVIARLHGATIEVTSEPDVSTKFIVSFPPSAEAEQP